MRRLYFFFFYCLIFPGIIAAQSGDTSIVPPADSILHHDTVHVADTIHNLPVAEVSKMPAKDSGSLVAPSWKLLENHPYFGFRAPLLVKEKSEKRHPEGKDALFYLLVFLLILYAVLRRTFPKYFDDLFRLFFRTTLKQRQIREQLMQTPLPSILLNGFFVVSAGLYIAFQLEHFGLNPTGNFWLLYLYCMAGLSSIYFVKFVGLKLTGWLFGMPEAAESYIFVVFIINKMIGILLLPFLVLLAFVSGNFYLAAQTLSWCLVGGLLVYRFILTYTAVRNQVKVNLFHFFLYLCAFEIAPLLLIYRALLLFFNISP